MAEDAVCRTPSRNSTIKFSFSSFSSAIVAIVFVAMILMGSSSVTADEWTDAGFTSLHRVVWLNAGFSLREAKRWKSRCGITEPKQVAEWGEIGLTTPTAVSFWMKKGYSKPAAVVEFRNRESSDQGGKVVEQSSRIPEPDEETASKSTSSDRKKRVWQRKSQIEELEAYGVDPVTAEEWIYAGYSSEETKEWLKLDQIERPDDVAVWLDIGISTPEELSSWYSKGLTTVAAVQKQMVFEKSEQEKFSRLNIPPEMVAEWGKVGAKSFNQVSHLINRGYSVDELQGWLASGFRTLEEIEKWRATGLGTKESQQWVDSGFRPSEASQLMESGFVLEEIKVWEGTFGPFAHSKELINSWRDVGFSAATAKRWIESHHDITAAIAATWRDNGYEPESEWVLLETSPEVIEQWQNSEQTTAEILLWTKYGFDEPTAQQWIEQGLHAGQAKQWRDQQYSAAVAQRWIGQGVNNPARAGRLKKITIDVSDYFSKGVTYNAFRKTAKILNIHKLPATLGATKNRQNRSVLLFDTLTPFAKCMTAYAKKTDLSDSAVKNIERAHFYQVEMTDPDGRRFMARYRNQCQDWTRYIFTIWLYASS